MYILTSKMNETLVFCDELFMDKHVGAITKLLTEVDNKYLYDDVYIWAFERGNLPVIKFLLLSDVNFFVSARENTYITDAVTTLASRGHLNCIQWTSSIEKYNNVIVDNCYYLLGKSCKNGNIECAKWFFQQIKTHKLIGINSVNNIFIDTCINNQLETAQWLFYMFPNIDFDIKEAFDLTDIWSQKKVKQWLYEQIKNKNDFELEKELLEEACYSKYNCVDIVEWICKIIGSNETYNILMEIKYDNYLNYKNSYIVKWLYYFNIINHDDLYTIFLNTCYNCYGDINTIKWIYQIDKTIIYTNSTEGFIWSNNTNIIKWLLSFGHIDINVCVNQFKFKQNIVFDMDCKNLICNKLSLQSYPILYMLFMISGNGFVLKLFMWIQWIFTIIFRCLCKYKFNKIANWLYSINNVNINKCYDIFKMDLCDNAINVISKYGIIVDKIINDENKQLLKNKRDNIIFSAMDQYLDKYVNNWITTFC